PLPPQAASVATSAATPRSETRRFNAVLLCSRTGGNDDSIAVGSAGLISCRWEREREAGRPAVALARDLVAVVDEHLHARRLEPPPGFVVTRERESLAAAVETEDVGPHGLELLVRDLDDPDLALREKLDKRHRHEWQIGNDEPRRDRVEERAQVQDLTCAPVV